MVVAVLSHLASTGQLPILGARLYLVLVVITRGKRGNRTNGAVAQLAHKLLVYKRN